MVEIYGIDNGYANTKLYGNTQIIFPSRIEPTTEDSATLEHDGIRYKIGTGTEDIEINKTNSLVHKICTYTAICRATECGTSVRLVLGLPLSHYRNKGAREAFKEYICKPSIVRYNNQLRTISIRQAIVFPQGASALYADHPEQYKGRLVAVLDIGGLTINGCIFEDLQPIPESMTTINAGIIILQNKIKSALNERLYLNVQDYEIPHLMQSQEHNEIIKEVADKHFEGVKAELRKKNWSIETLDMLGVGGGVLTARGALQKHFPRMKVSEEPIFANAKGLYQIGVSLWG